ncbi:MAG: hypothetical protein AB8C84_01065 [Oligoflexales bacterium]
MKKLLIFIILQSTILSACPLLTWEQNHKGQLHYVTYDLPLPDQNHFHITIKKIFHHNQLPTQHSSQSQWFVFHQRLKRLWFPSAEGHCSSLPIKIVNHSSDHNIEKKIREETISYAHYIKKYFPNYSLNAVFIVNSLEKLGSYNPVYKFILIKKQPWNFITHKTLIHELSHGLEQNHPQWFSEGLSEWIAIQYLEKIYPKKIKSFKKMIQDKSFEHTSLNKWKGRWKYEKSYKTLDFIATSLGKKKFFTILQKEKPLNFLISSLSFQEKKLFKKLVQHESM